MSIEITTRIGKEDGEEFRVWEGFKQTWGEPFYVALRLDSLSKELRVHIQEATDNIEHQEFVLEWDNVDALIAVLKECQKLCETPPC